LGSTLTSAKIGILGVNPSPCQGIICALKTFKKLTKLMILVILYNMSRNLRIQYEGAMFHVISRGNKDENIFADDERKSFFIKLIGEGSVRYQVDIYAYCVMSTHYHLLVQINELNLPEFMHFLGSSYANYLVRNGWYGHIFAGRYRALLIDREEYMLTVNRYIHLNPVSAAIAERPEDYRWSSYRLFIGRERPTKWLNKEWLVEYFGPGSKEALARYREFIEAGLDNPSCYPHDRVVANAILGGRKFLEEARAMVKEAEWPCEVERKAQTCDVTLEEIHRAICEAFNIEDLENTDYRRNKTTKTLSDLFIYVARKFADSSNEEIAGVLGGITTNSISHRYARIKSKLVEDAAYRLMIDGFVERVLIQLGMDPKRGR
jgi:putative transposase